MIPHARNSLTPGPSGDAVSMPKSGVSDRVRRCHDQHLLAFAWDVRQRAVLELMRELGCDAIFSDFLTLLAAA